ncbi:MAG: 3-dehydroquinate synthase [Opitutales bacterium]|nr:3-dehydroquinate synthase [Opitutales bacterium]
MPSTYSTIRKNIRLDFSHRVYFTKDCFSHTNDTLSDIVQPHRKNQPSKIIIYLDEGMLDGNPNLPDQIKSYFQARKDALHLVCSPVFIRGGEAAKNDWGLVEKIWTDLNTFSLCRHSYVIVIGGGAALDLVGFAASTAHRGIRLVRLPTTTLSQGDGGVGVKNGINFFGKKNWVGTFAVPYAVLNDFSFLRGLPKGQKRAGFVEAVKVALIRDRSFFEQIEARADDLAKFDEDAMHYIIRKSAALHLEHIAGSGDPFELGSARPLDFGHWVAHKLEQLSDFRIGHGDAVAIGLGVDLLYSSKIGLIKRSSAERCLHLLNRLGFELYDEILGFKSKQGKHVILEGLEEFREHLGGELTITLLQGIGEGVEVHAMDRAKILESVEDLCSRNLVRQRK